MFEKISNTLKLTWEELLYKVTWPSWDELQQSSIITLVTSFLIAIVVFLMDAGFEGILKVIYQLFE